MLALLVWLLRDGTIHADWFVTAPYVFTDHQRWGLPLMYFVFAIAVAILYFPCRWYAEEKARRPRAWMRII